MITPGPGVVEPSWTNVPRPEYPRQALRRRAPAEVRVVIAVLVDEDGNVAQALVKKAGPSNLGFDEAALEAARKAKFRPATKDGMEGRMWTELMFDFKRP